MATFRHDKGGDWVVQGTPAEVTVGKCKVERKDGSTRFVDVVSVGRPFNRNGETLVYGYLKARDEEPSAPKPVKAQESLPLPYDAPSELLLDGSGSPDDSPF
jgi:hypothetical protein